MSQSFFQSGIYSFSNAYERSTTTSKQVQGDWMIREQGFENLPPDLAGPPPVYDSVGGMLPEIISSSWARKSGDILDDQIQTSHRWPQKQHIAGGVNENAEELSFINYPQLKASTYNNFQNHKLVPNSSDSQYLQGFHLIMDESARTGRVLEGQTGLSLSLSSNNAYGLKDLGTNYNELSFHSSRILPSDRENQVHFGHLESARSTNFVKNSKYLRAAQELLQEFCCVGRGQLRNQKIKKQESRNPNSASDSGASSSKEHTSLSPSERSEYQRRKIKLLSMLDEVNF
ncbi:hypothetical protein CDL12_08227 [Handroanthus impetiginosus]|uniref:POX domain-containing protein n=1 Tax=Handroanthus impetiginosus TaxID=429701 RepID=A0A2G9HNI5_9LAMI|nr:hypothetical protein CDL12_08227 [Handroanthus impetiginosus]